VQLSGRDLLCCPPERGSDSCVYAVSFTKPALALPLGFMGEYTIDS